MSGPIADGRAARDQAQAQYSRAVLDHVTRLVRGPLVAVDAADLDRAEAVRILNRAILAEDGTPLCADGWPHGDDLAQA